MSYSDEDQTVYSGRKAIEFFTVANEYCLFFEKAEKQKSAWILEYFSRMAPLVYLKASVLMPGPEPLEVFNHRYVTEEQWEEVFKNLRAVLGNDDLFFYLDHNNDSQEASLSEHMADIYQDLKDFVMLYSNNQQEAKQNALALIGSLFGERLGIKLLQASLQVHHLLYRHEISPDLLDDENTWLF